MSRTILPLWPEGSPNNTPDLKPHLVLYPPTVRSEKPAGIVLVCPGGGYGMRADHEGAPFAELFSQHGFFSAVVHYRVSPNRYPAPQHDAARAVRIARKMAAEWKADANRVALMGFSAGGHLVTTVATQPDLDPSPVDDLVGRYSARPDRLIAAYPVVSFTHEGHEGSVKNLLGEHPTPRQRAQFSNELHVTPQNPPAFLFHTAEDAAVPVSNSLRFAAAYAAHKVPFELHVYPKGPHGVGLALDRPELKGWSEQLLAWLKRW